MKKAPETEKIYNILKEKINNGDFVSNEALPKEVELALILNTSRKTLRSALTRLALENRVERIKGKGTFVCDRSSQKDKILVIIGDVGDITNPGRYILPGIMKEAENMCISVETCTSMSLLCASPAETVKKLIAKNFSAIILFDANFIGTEPIIPILKGCKIPVLIPHGVPSDSEKTGFAVLGTDYQKVIYYGVEYLAQCGHKQIAYFAFGEHRIAKEKYFAALANFGLDCSQELRFESSSHNEHDKIIAALENWYDNLKKKPTALFCFSDYFALCAYEFFKSRNVRIPQDMAILSIGGLIGCDFFAPSLSAIEFDCFSIGETAMRTVMEMAKNHEFYRPFQVSPHYLSIRESTTLKNKDKK